MWTPRRIFVVVAGLLLFGGGFTIYSSLFGWIDGLPPLPKKYSEAIVDGSNVPELYADRVNPFVARLRQAFGPDCIEQTQTYNLKFEIREKGLVFAATESKILPDGRVEFHQLSVAIFAKTSREISTVHSDRAILTFEQPVRKIEDMGSRKITAAEIIADPEAPTNDPRKGKIHITNNRKTPEPEDDLILKLPGPLYYVDEPKPAQPHLWTFNSIEIFDRQNRPAKTQPESQREQPPTVTAEGMRVFLASEVSTPKGSAKKDTKALSNVSGVEHFELDRNVSMNFWTESGNMMGGPTSKTPPPKQPAKQPAKVANPAGPAEKVLVTIHTNGPFAYDMKKETAHFEVPPNRDPNIVEYVKVTRRSKGNNEDTLTSDYLDVQFKRRKAEPGDSSKPAPPSVPEPTAAATGSADDLELETLHAWGKSIAISSDENAMSASGYDLFYDTRIKQTVLKGSPMHAVKDNNLIRAPELILSNLDDKEKQVTRASSPGSIGMGDFDSKTQQHSRHAIWQDGFLAIKVKEQGRVLDLITLTGGAQFSDSINDQRIRARQLKLWTFGKDDEPSGKQPAKKIVKIDPKKSGANAKSDDDTQKALPHRLEAVGDVAAHSPDLIVHKTDYLNVWFKDVAAPAAAPEQLPGAREVSPSKTARDETMPKVVAKLPLVSPKGDPTSKKGPEAKKDNPAVAEKKDPPIELRQASRVQAWVNRYDGKNDLDKVHTEGNVVIHQDPTKENENGIDIAGHTVDMEHYAEGNHLLVTGNEKTMGEVNFDQVLIVADDINIDQRDNSAIVKGPGSMRLKSKTSLDGKELPKDEKGKPKESYIDINWLHRMELDGPIGSVRYEGDVHAVQNSSRSSCQTMQVWLDRPLYLNQADRANVQKLSKEPAPKGKNEEESQSPKVVKVLMDQVPPMIVGVKPKLTQPVSLEDQERLNGVLIYYKNLIGPLVDLDNANNKVNASGPGTVIIWQEGAKDPLADKPADDPKKKKPDPKAKNNDVEMKLTRVIFDKVMLGHNKPNLPKRAIFYNNVDMVHMAADRPDVKINIAHLPPGAIHLKCNQSLEVTNQSRKTLDKNGKEIEIKWQEMKAEGNVKIDGDDFDGQAGTVTYSEEKSLLILTGTVNNMAVLNRFEVKGGKREPVRGEKIKYNLKTKNYNIEGSIGGGS